MKKLLLLVQLLFILPGCTALNEDFDCPVPQGGSCKRMDQVYAEVNGETFRNIPLAKNEAPGPGMIRIWKAPWKDAEGNLHRESYLYSDIYPVEK